MQAQKNRADPTGRAGKKPARNRLRMSDVRNRPVVEGDGLAARIRAAKSGPGIFLGNIAGPGRLNRPRHDRKQHLSFPAGPS
jgi:hypothetical protein